MQKKLLDFAAEHGLKLSAKMISSLLQYVELVWQKKDMLNLTSVSNKDEIVTRHICDGLIAAAVLLRENKDTTDFTVADMGTGAGYIGLTVAIALPNLQMTLIDSLERRCAFLNWVIMKLALTNIKVACVRIGQHLIGPFDAVTERAMGQLDDILPLVAPSLKEEGIFLAYQSTLENGEKQLLSQLCLQEKMPYKYHLPNEQKDRFLRIFSKYGYC